MACDSTGPAACRPAQPGRPGAGDGRQMLYSRMPTHETQSLSRSWRIATWIPARCCPPDRAPSWLVRVGATSKALSADNRQCLDPATHQSISRHQPPLVQATQALRIAESWSHCTLKLDARDCSGESAAIRIFKIQGATEFERDNFLHEVTVTKTSRTSLTES